jgi:hypothetical protein
MADTSILGQAIKGGNTPGQDTSTLKGFYEAPNPLFRAMNQQTVTDISVLSEGKVGSFLRRNDIVKGDIATIIDASLDYFLGDKNKLLKPIDQTIKTVNTKRTFIPIIIKTDFKYALSGSNSVKYPLYIIFDSTPDDISLTKGANWTAKDFLGRPEPIWTYNNSSATTFSLTGKFFAESFFAHKRLLKLSDYIMSLVTPSELNYMPSPVTVFIGEWQQFRCIINNIQIKYQGPWTIKIDDTDINNEQEKSQKLMLQEAQASGIPSHAPYMFEATFSFTVVSKDNHVKYAEQVIATEVNSSEVLTKEDSEVITKNFMSSVDGANRYSRQDTGLYNLTTSTKYTINGQQLTQSTDRLIEYTKSAENLNLYENANKVRRLSDQGVISNAVSSQMLTLFTNVNPSSLNTPTSGSSLNPFKKLF